MIPGNINTTKTHPRVLVAPLDWGLGHATRSIRVISALRNAGTDVIIAADGPAALLLKKEFPELPILLLEGYHIRYGKGRGLVFRLLFQYFRVKKVIRRENNWLQKIIHEKEIDGVISDNRFGLNSPKVPCVFITHQLYIETGYKWLSRQAQKINYSYINRFHECWVPDEAEKKNYAGILSHPTKSPSVPVHYAGLLSRFQARKEETAFKYLFLLSGPEPQRSMLEEKIIKLISGKKNMAIVRGLPEGSREKIDLPGIQSWEHLPAKILNEVICSSEIVICRSGYSTIMDLVALQKQAILIPTPGQKEQEYLADHAAERRLFKQVRQSALSDKIFDIVPYPPPAPAESSIDRLVEIWLHKIRERS